MKTVLDLPDEIMKDAEASAASRGESLQDYVAGAVESRLRDERPRQGWRSVFGAARPDDVLAVDEVVSRDLETIVPGDWQ